MSDEIKPTEAPQTTGVVKAPGPPAADHFEEGDEAPPRGVKVMAIVRWALILAMAALALATWAHYLGWFSGASGAVASQAKQFYCPMHPSVVQDHPGECPICSMTLVEKPSGSKKAPPSTAAPRTAASTLADGGVGVTTYSCPMHPGRTSTDPAARCPDCGMKLEPSAASIDAPKGGPAGADVAGLGPVDLTPERIQLIGMRTAKVTRERVGGELRTVGSLAADESGLTRVHSRSAGWIESLLVSRTGQKVRKGQVLAALYSPDVLAAQQEYLNALRWSGGAAAVGGASRPAADLALDARRKLELLGIEARDLDRITAQGHAERTLELRSPSDGTVIAKAAVLGGYVEPGLELFEIADLSTVWFLADVFESDIARVSEGMTARLELAAFPGEKFTAKVSFLYPALDPQSRTLRVRFELKNPGQRLRPGMYGTAWLASATREVLSIPAEAFVDTGEAQYVFVALPEGRFEPRKVRPGARFDNRVEILEGLAEGDTVVTTGNFLLDSESRLRAAVEGGGAAAGAGAAPGGASPCDALVDQKKYPEKYAACRACEAHRGMGSMEEDCRERIEKPWK